MTMRVGPLDRVMEAPGVYVYFDQRGVAVGSARKTDFNKWSTEAATDAVGGTVRSYSHRTLARCDAEVLARYNEMRAASTAPAEPEGTRMTEEYVSELLAENRDLQSQLAAKDQKIADMDAVHRQMSQRSTKALQVARGALEQMQADIEFLKHEEAALRQDIELLIAALDGAGLRNVVPMLLRESYKSEPVSQPALISLTKEND